MAARGTRAPRAEGCAVILPAEVDYRMLRWIRDCVARPGGVAAALAWVEQMQRERNYAAVERFDDALAWLLANSPTMHAVTPGGERHSLRDRERGGRTPSYGADAALARRHVRSSCASP